MNSSSVSNFSYKELQKLYQNLEGSYQKLEMELAEYKSLVASLEQRLATKEANGEDEDEMNEDDDDDDSVEDENDPWIIKFRELRQYRSSNGDCKVPLKYDKNPQLGAWVNNQKTGYKNAKTGKKGQLSEEKIEKLDSIGFYWVRFCYISVRDLVAIRFSLSHTRDTSLTHSLAHPYNLVKMQGKKYDTGSPDPSFQVNFSALQEYKDVFGNCNVHPNQGSLGKFVTRVRAEFKRFKKGQESLISLDEIKELKSIGFRWKRPICRN